MEKKKQNRKPTKKNYNRKWEKKELYQRSKRNNSSSQETPKLGRLNAPRLRPGAELYAASDRRGFAEAKRKRAAPISTRPAKIQNWGAQVGIELPTSFWIQAIQPAELATYNGKIAAPVLKYKRQRQIMLFFKINIFIICVEQTLKYRELF